MNLKTIFVIAVINTVLAGLAFAQTNSDYKKVEVFGGFTGGFAGDKINGSDTIQITPVKRPFIEKVSSGYTGSIVFNLHRFAGIKGEFTQLWNENELKNVNVSFAGRTGVNLSSLKLKRSMYSIMTGIQIKDNSTEGRYKPFFHILSGIAKTKAKAENVVTCSSTQCPNLNPNSSFRFSAAVGGGLDVKVKENIEIRTFQFDYNPIYLKAGTAHNFRLSTGVVFRF